jgi:hypothetical protein
MGPNTLDEYVAALSECRTADDVFATYRGEMQREGFQNIVFAHFMPNGEHEIPFLELPSAMPRVYLAEKFIESDPVILSLKNRTRPFMWSDMMRESDWDKRSRHVFGACGELGCRNGLTVPFHLPNGRCDFFSLSFRDNRIIEPARQTAVHLKSYATWMRINEFEILRSWTDALPAAANEVAAGRPCNHDCGALLEISIDECRAIVAVDIAYRRYRAGLIELNASLQDFLGQTMLDRLIDRGLIYEDADDEHWRFVFRPGPIARAHLKSCATVPYHRDHVTRHFVQTSERPDL